MDKTKISIVGAGLVGSTIAHTLMLSSLVTEIVLVDANMEKAEGQAMDLNHCIPSMMPVKVKAGNYAECAGSKIVIITAGVVQQQNESRLMLTKRNSEIFMSIIDELKKYCKDSIILVVTNPVDVLTYVVNQLMGIESKRVIGTGTVLDTARFRYLLSEYIKVDSRNIYGYIIGEHGDSSVPVWSVTNVSGIDIDNYLKRDSKTSRMRMLIHKEVVDSAYKIIEKKGSTYYGIAVAVRNVVEAVLRNQNSIFTVSSYMQGPYGIYDVCLSLPTVINSSGVERVLEINLSSEEIRKIQNSANQIKSVISELKGSILPEDKLCGSL
ncbi:MAG: L-lactate dehydrogenase [Bacillota bacterium]|nr:L-lactate dehydrogenase [Bacillota bacterium]